MKQYDDNQMILGYQKVLRQHNIDSGRLRDPDKKLTKFLHKIGVIE